MRFFLLSLFTIITLEIAFTGCIKTDVNCDGCTDQDTTNNQTDTTNKDTVLTGEHVSGPLKISVRVGKPDGAFAPGALVKLAYTFDSIIAEKYFLAKVSDSAGNVVFTDLPVSSSTGKKSYYANAFFTFGGEEMSSVNGNGSNGPLEIRLTKGQPRNSVLVVTYK